LIKLQTIDIKINQRNKVSNGELGQINFYDISHQSEFYSNHIRHGNDLTPQIEHKQNQEQSNQYESRIERLNALEALLKPEQTKDYIPNQLLKKKKQKKEWRGLRL